MTAVLGGAGDGDQTTTTAGGVLTADPGGAFHLTINNSALKITAAPLPNFKLISGQIMSVLGSVDSSDLDYTRFGNWGLTDAVDGYFNVGAFATGFVTPAAQIPTQGTATYTGRATGIYNAVVSPADGVDFNSVISGNVSLMADFGQARLSGAITGITAAASFSTITGPVNDISFSAAIDRNNNMFSGTTAVAGQATGIYAFGPTASGTAASTARTRLRSAPCSTSPRALGASSARSARSTEAR